MEVAVIRTMLPIVFLIAILLVFLVPAWIRSRKRRATIAELKSLERKITFAESDNAEALAFHRESMKRLSGSVTKAELADLAGILAQADGECHRSSNSFAAVCESVSRLIAKNVPTEALASFVKDFERVSEDMATAQRVVQAFDKKRLEIVMLAAQADQRLTDLTLEVDRTEAGFQAAESRGFKLRALRAVFSSVKDAHIGIRDGLMAEHRSGDVITACERTSSLLNELNAALDRLHECVDDMRGNFAKQQKRRQTLFESLGHRRQDLTLTRIAAREQYLAVSGFDAQAAVSLEEAGGFLVQGGVALAGLDLDEAERIFHQAKECLDQAETKLAAIEAARPKPAAEAQPSM